MSFTLRPYQRDAVDAVFSYFENNKDGNCILALPTGSGKSIIQAAFIKQVLALWPGERFLLVSHVKELLVQNAEKIAALMPNVTVGVYSAGLGKKETGYQVTVAGVQSVYKHAHEMGAISIVIVDECHLVNKTPDSMYQRFLGVLRELCPHVRFIGMSATPYRLDSGPLIKGDHRVFTDIAHAVSIKDLIAQGYLAPLVSAQTRAKADASTVKKRGGEYIAGDLEKFMNTASITDAALTEVDALCADRKSWLVFCVGVDHARDVAQAIRLRGHSAEIVIGDTPKDVRAQRLEAFKRGEIRALVSVGVLTTGFDAPNADALICLRPTLSPGLWCLDKETQILTSHGWKGEGEIGIGDCILSGDPGNSMAGRWSRVLATIRRPMDPSESWVEYNAPRSNFRVTNNHRLIVKRKRADDWSIVPASSVAESKAGVYMPTAVHMNQPGVPLTAAELYLIGIIITDGSVTTHQVNIYQSERHPEIMKRIEAALTDCGLRWRKSRQKNDPGSYQERYPRWRYRISAGDPRRGEPGKGLRYMYPFLDKDLAPALMALSRTQFLELLSGVFDGDGFKKKHIDYTSRSWSICSARKTMIERMQALAAMHGCTGHLRKEQYSRPNPIWILTITPQDWRSVGGYHKDSRPQVTTNPATNETVWCVESDAGTIVTRRRGKVTVMGNCQMVGRVSRTSPGKENGLVLDFTANMHTHGPVDLIDIDGDGNVKTSPYRVCPECGKLIEPGQKACDCGYSFERECAKCHSLFDRDLAACPDCGTFVKRVERKIEHDTEASDGQVISDGSAIAETVEFMTANRHQKEGKPDSVKITYYFDELMHRKQSEWLCFDHGGYAARKAAQRWVRLGGEVPTPSSVEEALQRQSELTAPTEIERVRDGKYWRVL